jgi:hypothetical protein
VWRNRFCVAAIAAFPIIAQGQVFRLSPVVQPELRVGIVAAREPVALAGVAVNVPAGYYVRFATALEAGRDLSSHGGNALRAELAARFMADPFHQSRWGAYGGGGLVGSWRDGSRGQGALLLVAGVEWPGRGGWRPAIEVAGGAGLRIGLTLKPVRRLGR